jgi:ABC-type nitrate/sulfonate/bicarbonate transport system substrate-binding protein
MESGEKTFMRRDFVRMLGAGVGGLIVGGAAVYLSSQTATPTPTAAQVRTTTIRETMTETKTIIETVTVVPTPTKRQEVTLEIAAAPTSIVPWKVAAREGFDREYGINLKPLTVGYDVDVDVFRAGKSPIGSSPPWEIPKMIEEGIDAVLVGNAGGIRFFNSMFVRTEDGDKYRHPKDLVGKVIGLPPWGTGTTMAFEIVSKLFWNIDVKKDYVVKIAEGAALLPLLERKEIEACLLHSGQTISALARPEKYTKIFSFSDIWEASFGQPLVIVGTVARKQWAQKNWETLRGLELALDKAVRWIMKNAGEFVEPGGKYIKEAELAGWLRDEPTKELVKKWLKQGRYFLIESYTPAWVDANWEFVKLGLGIIYEKPHSKEEVFRDPLS